MNDGFLGFDGQNYEVQVLWDVIADVEEELEEMAHIRPVQFIGTISEFQKSQESFDDFLSRFEDYCSLNDHAVGPDEPPVAPPGEGPKAVRKKLIFLNYLDRETRATLNRLCRPAEPRTKTFRDLCQLLQSHFTPRGLVFAEEQKFQLLTQKDGQSVSDFVLTLKDQANKCNFGDQLDKRLMTQFVIGLSSEQTRDKLVDEEGLTFDQAMQIALQQELRQAQKKEMFKAREEVVNAVHYRQNAAQTSQNQRGRAGSQSGRRGNRGRPSQTNTTPGGGRGYSPRARGHNPATRGRSPGQHQGCWRCGGAKCDPKTCWAKDVDCFACGRRGHTARYHRTQVQALDVEEDDEAEDCTDEQVCKVNSGTEHARQTTASADSGAYKQDDGFYNELNFEDIQIKRVNTQDSESYIPTVDVDIDDELLAMRWCSEVSSEVNNMYLQDINSDNNICDNVDIDGHTDSGANKEKEVDLDSESNGNVMVTEDKQVNWITVNVVTQNNDPLFVHVNIEEVCVTMEIDTGSGVSIMHISQFKQCFPQKQLIQTKVNLRTVDGSNISVQGQCDVKVKDSSGNIHKVPLIVCDTITPFFPLLGRDWLEKVVINWREFGRQIGIVRTKQKQQVNVVKDVEVENLPPEVQKLVKEFPSVFSKDKSQAIIGHKARVVLKEGTTPVCLKDYEIAYSIKQKVTDQLREMIQQGRFIPTTFPQWASPLFPIEKPNGTLRLVADYKRSVNKNIQIDQYPLPKPEDIFNSLTGCHVFCVIDLTEAYLQLELEPESQEILVVNTHIGYLKPTRLMYGVANAPACFQEFMDKVLKGLPNTKCYIDDVVLGAQSKERMFVLLREVFKRFQARNLRINWEKSLFFQTQVEYLGHLISGDAIMPSPKRITAIVEAPAPTNLTELRSYLGAINFFRKFLPHASTILQPLTDLLKKGTVWHWDRQCQQSFENSKQVLMSNQVLCPYDPSQQLVLITDASQYGVGATLAHRKGKMEFPIAYASATLTERQRDYSQLEKEALAINFGLTKFYKFVAGRNFILVTDNMPLKSILSPDRPLPVLAAAKLKRCAIALSGFSYVAEYRKSVDMTTADMLSRLPSKDSLCELVQHVTLDFQDLPLNAVMVSQATLNDPVLCKVIDFVKHGWPSDLSDVALKPYFDVKYCISLVDECLMFGDRVIIPQILRTQVLEMLHAGHPGMVRMKLRARTIVFWPGITTDIENCLRNCEPCAKVNFKPLSTATCDWPKTDCNWTRLHLDFFYFDSSIFLILIDSHSKWLEIWSVTATSASQVITKLRSVFATFGLPLQLVSDNGPPFDSVEYLIFCTANDIVASKSPPYHPQGNGAAERAVQTAKNALKKIVMSHPQDTLYCKVVNFLFQYRNTPSTVTGISPAMLMLGYAPRTPLSNVKPNPSAHTYVPYTPTFALGDRVLVRRRKGELPEVGTVVKIISPTIYNVQIGDKCTLCHINQLQYYYVQSNKEKDTSLMSSPALTDGKEPTNKVIPPVTTLVVPENVTPTQERKPTCNEQVKTPIVLRKSQRICKPPQRLDL